ncbi:MAG TPA: tetratricopeptide repeat protein, partial [Ktedonobacterales bacterium]|nr:tetratricopeptide repeat protein [Ktedonobacterales bacterium]
LHAPTRHLLEACAVVGSRFSLAIAFAVAELSESEGVSALEEAERHVIVRHDHHSEVFTHDLVAEVISADLSAARKRLLHRRALLNLEQTGGAPPAELARHALAAEEWEPAFHACVQAGVAALHVGALHDAIQLHEQALRLATEPPSRETLAATVSIDAVDRLATFLGNLYFDVGDPQKQRTTYDAMVAAARAADDAIRLIVTLVRYGQILINDGEDLATARMFLEEAVYLAEQVGNGELIARASRQYGKLLACMNDCDAALQYGQHAVDLSRTIPEIEPLATSLLVFGDTAVDAGVWDRAAATAEECFALFVAAARMRQTQAVPSMANIPKSSLTHSIAPLLSLPPTTEGYLISQKGALSLMLLGIAQLHQGDLSQAQESLDVSWHHLRRMQAGAYRTRVQIWRSVGLLECGKYEEALQSIQEANAVACSAPLPRPLQLLSWCIFAAVYQALFQLAAAKAAIDEASTLIVYAPPALRVMPLTLRCINEALTHNWANAATAAMEAAAGREATSSTLLWCDFTRSHEVEALLRAERIDLAREALRHLNERMGSSRRYRLAYLRMRAILERWEGFHVQALATLHEARDMAMNIGLPTESWQIAAEMAQIFALQGNEEQRHTAHEHAEQTISMLAEGIPDPTHRARYTDSARARL